MQMFLVLLCYKVCYGVEAAKEPCTPGPQERGLAAYGNGLAEAAGHADRVEPLQSYCRGLLLPGERQSVEPMAARLAPGNVRRIHQSLHHVVADAPWSEEELLAPGRGSGLPLRERPGPICAWIVDATGFVKQGKPSVGLTRQYCAPVGTQENCRVAVRRSIATAAARLPIAGRLYLPAVWAQDRERSQPAGVPEEIGFQTKPSIAWDQIRSPLEAGVRNAPVVADAGYGNDSKFREGVTEAGWRYLVGVAGTTTVGPPGNQPLRKKPWTGNGRPPTRLRRGRNPRAVTVPGLEHFSCCCMPPR